MQGSWKVNLQGNQSPRIPNPETLHQKKHPKRRPLPHEMHRLQAQSRRLPIQARPEEAHECGGLLVDCRDAGPACAQGEYRVGEGRAGAREGSVEKVNEAIVFCEFEGAENADDGEEGEGYFGEDEGEGHFGVW